MDKEDKMKDGRMDFLKNLSNVKVPDDQVEELRESENEKEEDLDVE